MEVSAIVLYGILIVLFLAILFFTVDRKLVSNNFSEGVFPGPLSFFLFTVCVSVCVSVGSVINNYLVGVYEYVTDIFFLDIVFGILYFVLGYFLVRAFLQREGDAIFLAFGFLSVCLLSNIVVWTSVETIPYKSVIYCLIFGLYLYYSDGVEECIPSGKRYIELKDHLIVGGALVWCVVLLIGIMKYF